MVVFRATTGACGMHASTAIASAITEPLPAIRFLDRITPVMASLASVGETLSVHSGAAADATELLDDIRCAEYRGEGRVCSIWSSAASRRRDWSAVHASERCG